MPLTNPRAITLLVAFSTLTSNVVSSVLLHKLPDDPFHLAGYGGWYLHFAGVLSVFGIIGALRQHGPSIALFANYLLLDTVLCALPRFLLPLLLSQLSSTLCSSDLFASAPAIQNPYVHASHHISPSSSSTTSSTTFTTSSQYTSSSASTIQTPQDAWAHLWSGWSEVEGGMQCENMLYLLQVTMIAGALVATVLQFVGALCVRRYAKVLWLRELMEEELYLNTELMVESPGRLDVIPEEKA